MIVEMKRGSYDGGFNFEISQWRDEVNIEISQGVDEAMIR